jgi:hypothetical protein
MSAGSFTLEEYMLEGWAAGLIDKGWMVPTPFSVVCSGVVARISDVVFDDLRKE